MEEHEIENLVARLLAYPIEIAKHREAISELAARRRELAVELKDAIGPKKAAERLGISRQVLWQILNPTRAQDIKRRSQQATKHP